MKTKKFLMLLAAVLLSCVSAMAQNSPLKGDVNGDGKVDVADIVAILEIMKNGVKELQSIKWATTTAVSGTTGTTPSLGDITLTYNDGTTGTVAYNASGVTLYTDAAGNTPFSNANSGTFNVWAKYCGMTTTNSKQVTLSAPVAGTYKYYAGVTDKVSFTESDLDQTTTTRPTTLSFGAASGDNFQIFIFPTSWGTPSAMMAGGLDGKGGWTWGDSYVTVPAGYTCASHQGGSVTYTVTWPTTYYWYAGQTDPSTMTEISPMGEWGVHTNGIECGVNGGGWYELGTTIPETITQLVKGGDPSKYWYVAVPITSGTTLKPVASDMMTLDTSVSTQGTKSFNGISYQIYWYGGATAARMTFRFAKK